MRAAPSAIASVREAVRPRLQAYRPDPDAWPTTASAAAVWKYRRAVLAVVPAFELLTGKWECSTCGLRFWPVFYGAGRRWWECPRCAPSERLRRAVRRVRGAWSWTSAEREAAQAEEQARAAVAEDAARAVWSWFSSMLGQYGPIDDVALVEVRAAAAARIDPLPPVVPGAPAAERRFRCRGCSAEWEPFAPIGRDSCNRLVPYPGELRGALPWWACPKKCNIAAGRRVLRLAAGRGRFTRRWVQLWLGVVDGSSARRLSGFRSREVARQTVKHFPARGRA